MVDNSEIETDQKITKNIVDFAEPRPPPPTESLSSPLSLMADNNEIEAEQESTNTIAVFAETCPPPPTKTLSSPLSRELSPLMVDNNETETKQKNLLNNIAKLRKAMMKKDYKKVRRLCDEVPEGPLQIISVYDDTVLHMAAHSKQNDLLLDLLEIIPEDRNPKLSDMKNSEGNSTLHEIATNNTSVRVTKALLNRAPSLLNQRNNLGEEPIFCAARHGQTEKFQFLAKEMKLKELSPQQCKAHLQRNDKTTVLHVSVAIECFDLALFIIKNYPYLVEERDRCWMTALQYLACTPTVFRRGEIQIRQGFMELLNKSMFLDKSKNEEESKKEVEREGLALLFKGIGEVFFKKRESNDKCTLRELVRLLVEKDTSWDANINSQAMSIGGHGKEPEIEECSSNLSQTKERQNSPESSIQTYKSDESALFLATISNIREIVKEELKYQPQALKRTNKDGMNILHVAILYRHIDIFDMVIKNEELSRRLLSATDNEGNSVLHMVSKKRKSQASEKMQSPALQLRDELLLFEKVKSASKMYLTKPLNNKNKTAEELFAAANEQLHGEAKEWLMRTTENCTILSVFIATVSFAAIYTVPGGPDQNTGIPLLHSKPSLLVFILADVISLALALTSVGTFLSILTSSFPLEDFKIYLFKKLIQGIICMVLSVSMMAVAFGAAIILMTSHNQENVFWSMIAFLPVPIFFQSYSPLRSAIMGPCWERFKIFTTYFLMGIVVVCLLPLIFAIILSHFFNALGYVISTTISWIYWVLVRIPSLFFWTVRKVCLYIIYKPLSWICGIESTPISNTESSQPNAASPPPPV